MKFKKERITPQKANELLSLNRKNRNRDDKRLARYKQELLAGEWITNTGECIIIDEDDNLISGQHRLIAIVETGVAIEMWIARGADRRAYLVIDGAKPRTAKDAFQADGDRELGRYQEMTLRAIKMMQTDTKDDSMTTQHAKRLKESCPGLNDSILFVKEDRWATANRCGIGWLAALHYIAVHDLNSKSVVEPFIDSVVDGVNLTKGSCVFKVHNRIHDKRSNMSAHDKRGYIIEAWNSIREGREMSEKVKDWNTYKPV